MCTASRFLAATAGLLLGLTACSMGGDSRSTPAPSTSVSAGQASEATTPASAATTGPATGPDHDWVRHETERAGDAARGARLVERYECGKCHQGATMPKVHFQASCVGCHEKIQAGTYPTTKEKLAVWKKNITHYNSAPSLDHIGSRIRPSWIAALLVEPTKIHARSEDWMPRMDIPERDARDMAAYLTRGAKAYEPAGAYGDARRGRVVVETKGCMLCHTWNGGPPLAVSPMPKPMAAERFAQAMKQAPDLSLTRTRFRRDVLVTWLLDPSSIKHDALMPNLGLSEAEARDAAAFLTETVASPVPAPAVVKLPALSRKVSFAEVTERVFGGSCGHCHQDPNMMGLGGPGSTGGFGFPARGIQLSSWDGTRMGYADGTSGKRHSFFTPTDSAIVVGQSETRSRLVASLLARHEEVNGRPIPGLRGMPMGLPPLSLEDIALVEAWVNQGGPR